MTERPRELGDFKGVGHLRLHFRLKRYVSRQYLWTVRWGNSYSTALPLKVFTQTNFVADFIRLKLNFIENKKTTNCLLRHRLGDLWITYALHL